jgi:hypothetical protein
MRSLLSVLIACTLLSCQIANAVPTIYTKGAWFFTSDGDRFFIKGVVYQPYTDNYNGLVDGKQCAIDAKLLRDLGANVISVYAVDPTLNHDDCMGIFAEHGIYVIIHLQSQVAQFNRVSTCH